MSYRHAKKPAGLSLAQQAALLKYIRALLAQAKRPRPAAQGPDIGRAVLTGAVKEGLSFIPVAGPILGALAGPIVSGISDWFSAGEAGEKFFHETYLPKAATPISRSQAKWIRNFQRLHS
jgi:hypothetical protein